MMLRFVPRWKLTTKLTLTYSILLLFVSGVMSAALYQQLQSEQQQAMRDQLRYILIFTAPQVDIDFHAALREPGDERTSWYNLVYLRLRTVQKTISAIQHIYTLRTREDGSLGYVVDDEADPTIRAQIGQVYPYLSPVLSGGLSQIDGPLVEADWRTNLKGQMVLFGYAPIYDRKRQVDGVLGIEIDASGLVASQQTAMLRALLAFFLTAPLALFIGWVMLKIVLSPIFDLMQGTQRIAQGNLDVPVPVHGEDELGQLANTFNTMQTGLHESRMQLEDYARTLEQRVARRTAQLAQANAEIQALNTRLTSENLRMEAELEVTRRLQQMLLPSQAEMDQVEGLEITGYMQPANEVGGDYYDILQYGDRVKIGIGDVTGHGLESGVVMLMAQTAIRTLLTSNEYNSTRFMDILNRSLHANLHRMGLERSLSLILLDYQFKEMRFTLSGQHEKVIVVRKGGQVEVQDTLELGFPVGLVEEIAGFMGEIKIHLEPGDGIVLYSDGFTEAENDDGELYKLERLCAAVSAHWANSAAAIKDAAVADVKQFIGQHRVYDDLALLVIKQK
jgi:sigma-B regulation protein RsbU (phosphoserine phosphatase)